jgi:hypothetical protein
MRGAAPRKTGALLLAGLMLLVLAGAGADPGGKIPGLGQSPGGRPFWADDPYAVFPRSEYFAATGYAADRSSAEKNALAALTALFGQNIQAELRSVSSYTEAVSQGRVQFEENTSLENAVRTTTQLDTLLGAEIRGVWDDGRSLIYAVAVMEKAPARRLYASMIRANSRILDGFAAMPAEERNSLGGYARCRFAALAADANVIYGRVLTMLGGEPGLDVSALRGGDEYRLAQNAIAQNIRIQVRVSGDRSNRIREAFSGAITKAGFRSGAGGRYVLDVTVSLEPLEFLSNSARFCRYTMDSGLRDTQTDSVFYITSMRGREGHPNSIAEAENLAIRAIENEVAGTYAEGLVDFLSTMLPSP